MPNTKAKMVSVQYAPSPTVELVNQLHKELREAESEQPDLLRLDFTGTTKEVYWKEAQPGVDSGGLKRVEAYVVDNRERWKALNDMYWFHVVVIPLMANRKSA